MSDTMRAAVLVAPGSLRVESVPAPRLRDDEVLVRPEAVGVCGTDFHIYSGEANYNLDARGRPVPLEQQPQILGHEIAGVIEEIGAGVADLRTGDRVVVDQGRNCRSQGRAPLCEYCASGHSHQCAHYQEHGITGLPGGFAGALAVPAVNAVKLSSDLPAELAALAEPLGCVLHSSTMAARATARYQIGAAEPERRVRTILILGAGPAGLLFLQVLRKVQGFDGLVLVSEPNPFKRALAERLGASTLDPAAADLVEAVSERTGGRRVEYLIEASGSGTVYAQIPGLIRKQATVLQYGVGHGHVPLSLLNGVQWREPTFLLAVGASGGFDQDGRPSIYRRALRLLEEGRVEVQPWISHYYDGLEAVPQAFAGDQARPDYVKGVVRL